jgi:hypothetical protein
VNEMWADDAEVPWQTFEPRLQVYQWEELGPGRGVGLQTKQAEPGRLLVLGLVP